MTPEKDSKVRVQKDRSARISFANGREYFRTKNGIWMAPETGSNQWILLNDSSLTENLNNLTANVIGETRFVFP